MRSVLIGSSGFLGSHLSEALSLQPIQLDLTKPVTEKFEGANYVIICAAVTDVEKCFQDQAHSRQVNVTGTQHLLNATRDAGAIPVFFSSDYVFTGINPHQEDEPRNPSTVYGQQKAEIERFIESHFETFLIFRTSKLMSKTAHARNILYPIIRALSGNKPVPCFRDQWINPIFVEDIAEVLTTSFSQKLSGTYHLGTQTVFTRFGLAQFLAQSLGFDTNLIHPIAMSEVKSSEIRPTHNLLNCDKIRKNLPFRFTEIQEALTDLRALAELS